MKKTKKILPVILVVAMVLGNAPVVALAADPEPFNIVESRLVTEVLDWGETITAVRIEYSDEIYCGSIWHSLEYSNELTYKIVSKRDIVNIYVNNSGKKDDIQLQGKYVFINLGIENEDYNTYRDQIVFQDGRRTRTQPIPYYLVQNVPITSVSGKVAPARAFSTTSSAMTAAKNAALPDMNGTLGDNVREIRTASTEVRVDVDNFRTFEYANPVTGTKLKFHLYIPQGYEVPKAANTNPALPMVVHFANSGDMNYDDDTHMANIADRRYLGAVFTHPDATYWVTEDAQKRNPSFVMSLAGPNGGTYGGDLPAANWGNWYANSQMQQDFMAAVRWVKERFKIDEDRVGAINLAGSTSAMLGTLLSDEVDDFSACILTAYDPYHVFGAGNLSTPIGGTPQTTYEGRMQYAETQFSKVMNKMATWQFAGLNDRTGVVSGDTTYVGYDDTYPGRFKGERMLDFAYRMNLAAEKTVVVANGFDNMWNGLINAAPTSNQALKGPENEIKAQAQWNEAKSAETEHLVTVFMPGTVMESMHWSWNPAYGNLVVQDWLYAQNRKTHKGFPIGPGAADYTPQSPRTPFRAPNDAETARMVEARLVTEVLDWGETITAVRLEYSEEIRVDAVEYSEEHANRMTYQMATNRDIVNLYVNNSGKKDDYQTQGKYVFINLGQVNGDFTSYRDQVVFEEGLRIRARPEPYYLYQAFPITTVNGNVIQPRGITTATSAIRGALIDSELPNIEQMDVWSTEVRVDIDGFRSFAYTNPENSSLTKFHLYIPPGYEKKDANLDDIPIIVHFPAGDTRYNDDNLSDAGASRQMGALFSHNDATVWSSEKSQALQKAFVLTPGPNWNDNYMFIVKALVENLNIDISRIYAVSLASGSTAMWNTILANPGVFAGQLNCSYDPYHSFAGGSGTYEERALRAETTFAQIMDQLPGWFFAGLNDASGSPVSGDPLSRLKGERWRDLGFLMNGKGYNIDVSWGEKGELMWNGMLRGQKAEAMANAQLSRANTGEAEQLITLFVPNTILQSAHWSWMGAYTNSVVREWLYAQANPDPVGTANIIAPGSEGLAGEPVELGAIKVVELLTSAGAGYVGRNHVQGVGDGSQATYPKELKGKGAIRTGTDTLRVDYINTPRELDDYHHAGVYETAGVPHEIEELRLSEAQADAKYGPELPKYQAWAKEISQSVYNGLTSGKGVFVVGSNCAPAVGVAGGMRRAFGDDAKLGIIYVDAHGDINTKWSTFSGSMGGMDMAPIVGLEEDNDWWEAASNNMRTFDASIHACGRDLDSGIDKDTEEEFGETLNMEAAGTIIVKVEDFNDEEAWCAAVEELAGQVDAIYLHIDADAVDRAFLPNVGTPCDGGPDIWTMMKNLETVMKTEKVAVIKLASVYFGNRNLQSFAVPEVAFTETNDQYSNRLSQISIMTGTRMISTMFSNWGSMVLPKSVEPAAIEPEPTPKLPAGALKHLNVLELYTNSDAYFVGRGQLKSHDGTYEDELYKGKGIIRDNPDGTTTDTLSTDYIPVPRELDEYHRVGLYKMAGVPYNITELRLTNEQAEEKYPNDPKYIALARETADAVYNGLTEGEGNGMLIVGERCTPCVGVSAGIRRAYGEDAKLGLVYIDAHGDINTKWTTFSGMMGGMNMAPVVGLDPDWWEGACGGEPLKPFDASIHACGRDLDAADAEWVQDEYGDIYPDGVDPDTNEPFGEILNMQAAGTIIVDVDDFNNEEAWKAAVKELADQVDVIYLHIDEDAVDNAFVPNVGTPCKGGPDIWTFMNNLKTIMDTDKVAVIKLASVYFGREYDARKQASQGFVFPAFPSAKYAGLPGHPAETFDQASNRASQIAILSGMRMIYSMLEDWEKVPALGGLEISEPSSDATMATLTVNAGELKPAFSAGTTSYTVSVANSVASITIGATANHEEATVEGTGMKNLSVGANIFIIVVTAEDGTVNEYTVTVTRAASSGPSGPTPTGGGGGSPATIVEPTVPLADPIPFAPFITGFENNTFRGSQPMTREQFVAILYRLNVANPAAYEGDPSFKDVSIGRWSYDAIEWASGAGIIEADGSGNFRPAAPLTRADMAVMFVKVEGLTEIAENIFSDIEGHYAADDILKAVEAGIFTGYPEGTFKPEGSTTRSEAVAALVRYLMGGEPADATWQNLTVTFTDVSRTDWAYKYIVLAVIGNSLPPK